MLLVSFLEGALMLSRLAHDREPLLVAQAHLNTFLESEVRKRGKKR